MCSREEYLKRYLSEGIPKGAKKSKSKLKTSNKRESRFKIVDGDVDIKSLKLASLDVDDEYGDEAPVVANIVDERPDYIKISELYDSNRWKKVESHTIDDSTSGQKFMFSKEDTLKTTTNVVLSLPRDSRAEGNDGSMCSNHITATMPNELVVLSHQQKVKNSDSDKCVASLSKCNRKNSLCESCNDLHPDRIKGNKCTRQSCQLRVDSNSDISTLREISTSSSHQDMKLPVKSHAEPIIKHMLYDCDVSDIKVKYPVSRKSDKKRIDSNEIKMKQKSSVVLGVDSDGDLSPQRIVICPNSPDVTMSEANRHLKQKPNSKRHDSESDSSYEHHQKKKSKFSKTIKNSQNMIDLLIIDENAKRKEGFKYDFNSDLMPSQRSAHESFNHNSKSHIFSDVSGFDSKKLVLEGAHHTKRSEENHYADRKRNPTTTLSGMKAGLQDASTLRKEMKGLKNREERMIHEIGDEVSGRIAETILRDRSTGKRRDLKGERLKQKEKEKITAEQQEKYMEWGKGMKQKEERAKKLNDDCYEMTKPLARYRDDCDLERDLKEQLHNDDPMLEYMLKKRAKQQPNTHNVPAYSGSPAPPNRFSIKPGYRWDGVDRSNGFEKKCFSKHNEKKAFDEEAHKWSIQNM